MTIVEKQRESRSPPQNAKAERLVWDLPLRLVHWSLVVSFVGAFVTNRLGVAWFDWHVRFGYAVLGLVAFRVMWGFVGAKHARFASFLRSPAKTLSYARRLARGDAPSYVGHNPLGALMVVALLIGLGAQAGVGLFANDEIFNSGPLAGAVAKETSLALTSWHRRGFYALAIAAAIHVVAVLAHVFVKRENLVRAMITGRKPQELVRADDEISSSRLRRAMALMLLVAAMFLAVGSFVTTTDASLDAF
ncbi:MULTISPECIES: cytochrome b/b6 domain-containing protein [Methylosinus]|uniref:Cytochrome B n=1 Tax=Methylosinus trichosporium (strain ATCC 35070 / NCIMB 11131 / UNIQEM 75 / OB3b) TaxID=595536 RepID=A0A2D2D1E4_METT3|nr:MULTISPECIES: cytochrome b/b6 domain-containing protein [Methylosinus]ATQ68825.1 cytochrome B [Methylosinus trichosporium OB3b]OBS52235.1 cytochrome B [Methylosinus sp. 3S-1]